MADERTLRLASLQLTAELLEQFITYEQALLAALKGAGKSEWAGRYAFGHAEALKASKLDALVQQKLRVQVQDFCGKASAIYNVKTRLAVVANKPGKDAEAVEKMKRELAALEAMHDFTLRYGEAAVQLLKARSAELLALHETLVKAEGTGHLHASPSALLTS